MLSAIFRWFIGHVRRVLWKLAITKDLALYITSVDSRVNTSYASSLLHYELNAFIINSTKNSFDVQFFQWTHAFGIFTFPLGLRASAGSTTPAVIKERRLHQQWYQPPVSHGATVRHPPLRIFVKSTDSSRCRLDNDATRSGIDIMVGEPLRPFHFTLFLHWQLQIKILFYFINTPTRLWAQAR